MSKQYKNFLENPLHQGKFLGGSIALYLVTAFLLLVHFFTGGIESILKIFHDLKFMFGIATLLLAMAKVRAKFYILPALGIIFLGIIDFIISK